VLDGFLPVMPAEFLALGLMILQPTRLLPWPRHSPCRPRSAPACRRPVVNGIAQAASAPGWLEIERLSAGWNQAVSLIQSWGRPPWHWSRSFPDSPRTFIAVAALAGIGSLHITGSAPTGKLLLYAALALAVRRLPSRLTGVCNGILARLRACTSVRFDDSRPCAAGSGDARR
jgi:hypothetical protein